MEKRSETVTVKGTVKFFDEDKGWGFIAQEGGDDVFLHRSALKASGISALDEGDIVEFDLVPGKQGKGPKAGNVKLVAA